MAIERYTSGGDSQRNQTLSVQPKRTVGIHPPHHQGQIVAVSHEFGVAQKIRHIKVSTVNPGAIPHPRRSQGVLADVRMLDDPVAYQIPGDRAEGPPLAGSQRFQPLA